MKPTSRVRIRASRLNGALSRGPVTEAGKRRSAANAIYHGLYSKQVVLPHESQKAFEKLIKQHVEDLQPRDSRELALAHDMAVTRWRLHRLWHLEKQVMDDAIPPQHYIWTDPLPEPSALNNEMPDPDGLTFDTTGVEDRLGDALIALMSHRKFQTLQHHQFRLQRLYHRSLARLLAGREPQKAKGNRKN